jgi:DNA-binding MarR family transcriptional regulator
MRPIANLATSGSEHEQDDREADDAAIERLSAMPGYLLRRARQKSSEIFLEVCDGALTPVQYAVLTVIAARPGLDQSEVGELSGLDTSTAADVLQRLEARRLILRRADGRRRASELSPEGRALLETLGPKIERAQTRILATLTSRESEQLLRLLSKMVGVSNRYHSAPKRPRRRVRSTAV